MADGGSAPLAENLYFVRRLPMSSPERQTDIPAPQPFLRSVGVQGHRLELTGSYGLRCLCSGRVPKSRPDPKAFLQSHLAELDPRVLKRAVRAGRKAVFRDGPSCPPVGFQSE